MGWQETVALAIVAATASMFLWKAMRPRRFSFQAAGPCGCSNSSTQIGPKQSIVLRARKGERPQILVRNS
jgi:hypothetical protein